MDMVTHMAAKPGETYLICDLARVTSEQRPAIRVNNSF